MNIGLLLCEVFVFCLPTAPGLSGQQRRLNYAKNRDVINACACKRAKPKADVNYGSTGWLILSFEVCLNL